MRAGFEPFLVVLLWPQAWLLATAFASSSTPGRVRVARPKPAHEPMNHLLIVDREDDLLWALSQSLFPDRRDVLIHTASSGEQAIELMRQHPIDLLVVDLLIPDPVDGFNLILKASDKIKRARLVVMTTFRSSSDTFEPTLGITHYIGKPFVTEHLRGLLSELLSGEDAGRGVLEDLALADILAMLCASERTVLLYVSHRGRRGRIEIDKGELNHAQFDGKSGPEALWTMLGIEQGDIFLQNDFKASRKTLDRSWEALLTQASVWLEEHGPIVFEEAEVDIPLEGWDEDIVSDHIDDGDSNLLGFSEEELAEMAMDPVDVGSLGFSPPGQAGVARQEEETLPRGPRLQPTEASGLFDLPDQASQLIQTPEQGQHSIFAPVRSAAQKAATQPVQLGAAAQSVDDLLRALKEEVPDFVAAEFLNLDDGMLVAGVRADDVKNYDAEHVAAYYGDLLRACRRAAVAAESDAHFELLQITTEHHYILSRAIAQTSFAQLLTVGREGNLGLAQVLLRRVSTALVDVLPR